MRHGDNIIKGIHDKAVAEIKDILLSGNLKLSGVKARYVAYLGGKVVVDAVHFTYQQKSFGSLSNYARELLAELIRKDLENWSFEHKPNGTVSIMTSFTPDQIPKIKVHVTNASPSKPAVSVGFRNRDWNHDL